MNTRHHIELNLLFSVNEANAEKNNSKEFHAKCDNQGATVLIVQSSANHVFGGYASISWQAESISWQARKDKYAFLFLLRSQFAEEECKVPRMCKLLDPDNPCAVFHYCENHGPAWGNQHALIIDSPTNTYTNDKEFDFVGNELCGKDPSQEDDSSYSNSFVVKSWEVFQ